jgi:hypothetical protein
VVSKTDLMSSVWPGAIVEENTLQVHISALRKALGPGPKPTEDGVRAWLSPSRELELAGGERAAKHGREQRAAVASTTIPEQFAHAGSDLIGRAAALQHLRDRISAHRVVTLTGPGGIGKTRLAVEVAHSLMTSLEGNIALVELVSLPDPQLVPSAVAGALGLPLRRVRSPLLLSLRYWATTTPACARQLRARYRGGR